MVAFIFNKFLEPPMLPACIVLLVFLTQEEAAYCRIIRWLLFHCACVFITFKVTYLIFYLPFSMCITYFADTAISMLGSLVQRAANFERRPTLFYLHIIASFVFGSKDSHRLYISADIRDSFLCLKKIIPSHSRSSQ